jgi:hypothetical protein
MGVLVICSGHVAAYELSMALDLQKRCRTQQSHEVIFSCMTKESGLSMMHVATLVAGLLLAYMPSTHVL